MYKIIYKIDGGLVVQIDDVNINVVARTASLNDYSDSEFATAHADAIPEDRDGYTKALYYINNTLSATYTPIKGWIELATTEDLTKKIDKIKGAKAGNLIGIGSAGNLTDSGVAIDDVVTKDMQAQSMESLQGRYTGFSSPAGDNSTKWSGSLAEIGKGDFMIECVGAFDRYTNWDFPMFRVGDRKSTRLNSSH